MSLENGALDICVVKDPVGGDTVGDRFTGMQLTPSEWAAIFHNVLKVPEEFTFEDFEQQPQDIYERQEQLFRSFVLSKGYEMLSRIWDIYQDALFLPSEVDALQKECRELEHTTLDRLALSGLKKLRLASEQAIDAESGLALFSD